MGSFFSQVDLAPDVKHDMTPDMTHDGTPEHSGSRSALLCELRCSSQENDCSGITHQRFPSSRGFGQYVHAPYCRRYSELAAHLFGAHNRGLAAYPAFLAIRKFGWKNQHQFDFGARFHLRLAVEEDAAAAHVAGLS
jgi:hypothetical protein